MSEQYIQANGLKLCYETFGEASNPTVLLIMGLGTQMIGWSETFCEGLVEQGFHVLRFDNRDVGLSEKIDFPPPKTLALIAHSLFKRRMPAAYTLHDMADDSAALLEALDIDAAHIVGASMGGMIAQVFAAAHPSKTLSLTSIMSTSGASHLPKPSTKVLRHMLKRGGNDEEQRVNNSMALWRIIGSPGYPPSDADLRAKILRGVQRSNCPQGYLRQVAAIAASGDRVELLKTINVPTVVIHGTDDVLVPYACGEHTAQLIPHAKLKSYVGMGHDIPVELMPSVIAEITAIAK